MTLRWCFSASLVRVKLFFGNCESLRCCRVVLKDREGHSGLRRGKLALRLRMQEAPLHKPMVQQPNRCNFCWCTGCSRKAPELHKLLQIQVLARELGQRMPKPPERRIRTVEKNTKYSIYISNQIWPGARIIAKLAVRNNKKCLDCISNYLMRLSLGILGSVCIFKNPKCTRNSP